MENFISALVLIAACTSPSTASRRRPGSAYTSNGIVDFLKEVEASLPSFAHKPEYFRYIKFTLDFNNSNYFNEKIIDDDDGSVNGNYHN